MAAVEKDFRVKNGFIVGNGSVTSDVSTVNLFDTGATTLNIGGAGTAITIGATTGTTTIRNALTVNGTITGNLNGNASTATALQTARTISLGGDLSGSASFDGTANITITATIGANSVALGTDTTGDYVATASVSGNGLTGSATGEGSSFTVTSNATAANTNSTIVFRDATGSFAATGVTLSGDIAVNGGDLTTTATTFNLVNATATTVNIAGAATSLTIGSTTGTTTIRNASTVVTGDLAVNGGDITTTSTTATLFNTTATTVNIAGAGTSVSIGAGTGTTSVNNNLTVAGNLTVNGTTTTVNSTVTTLDDPVITLGGDTAPAADDNKDRGVEFRWHNGTAAKVGFFGFDDSTGFWTFIPDATNTSEVFAGATGVLDVSRITGSAATLTTARTISLSGDLSGSASFDGSQNITIAATIQPDSVALGTDTTGNYAASVAVSGNGLTITGAAGEGTAFTVNSNATSANTANTIVFRGAAGEFAAGAITVTNVTASGDIAVNGGDITTTATTFNLVNATATTVNFAQAATTLSMGATTGTTTIRNNGSVGGTLSVTGNATFAGDLALNGGDLTTTATTATLFNTTATTVNIAGAGTSVSIGSTTGTTTIRNDLTVSGGDIILGGTGRIQGIDTVTDATDAASKQYVDTAVANATPVETTTTQATANTATTIYTYSATSFRTAKIVVQATHATAGFHSQEVFMTHNGTDVHFVEFADIFTVGSLFELTANITGGNVTVTATPVNANTTFKVVSLARVSA